VLVLVTVGRSVMLGICVGISTSHWSLFSAAVGCSGGVGSYLAKPSFFSADAQPCPLCQVIMFFREERDGVALCFHSLDNLLSKSALEAFTASGYRTCCGFLGQPWVRPSHSDV